MKMLIILAFAFLTTTAFAQNNLEKFFARAEGSWNLVNSQITTTSPQGEAGEIQRFSSFSMKITKESNGWSVYEESCMDDECGESWSIYTITDNKLMIVTVLGKNEVKVLASLPTRLNYSYIAKKNEFTNKFSFNSAGHLIVQAMTKDENRFVFNRAIVLRK